MDWVTTWTNSLNTATINLATKVGAFLPNVIFAILILVIGWVIASSLSKVLSRALDKFGLDELWENLGLQSIFEEVGFKFRIQDFVASLVKWFIILVVLIAASDALNLPQISSFIEQVAAYVPNVIAASVILFIAIVAGNALANAASKASRASQVVPAHIIAAAVRYPIMIFGVLAALSQLRVAEDMVRILFGGFVFALSLALGLAFGLGGRDEAKRILEGLRTNAGTAVRSTSGRRK